MLYYGGMDQRLLEFIEQFNRQEFFEAHETLEVLWLETEGEDKNFYKGLIQCAVAFVHLERGNYKGAHKLFRTACGYLSHYLPEHGGVHTEKLLADFEAFFATHVAAAEPAGRVMDLDQLDTPKMQPQSH